MGGIEVSRGLSSDGWGYGLVELAGVGLAKAVNINFWNIGVLIEDICVIMMSKCYDIVEVVFYLVLVMIFDCVYLCLLALH